MNIIENYATGSACWKRNLNPDSNYAKFQKEGAKGAVLHSVGCPQPSAEVFAKNWHNLSTGIMVHGFIDALSENKVIRLLPDNYKGVHAGSGSKGSANQMFLGFEMCEPDCIKYTSGSNFTCSNKERALKQAWTAYNTAVKYFAVLCKSHNWNPLDSEIIMSHAEAYQKGYGTNHGDPQHLWTQLGMGITMDDFRKAVYKEMHKEEDDDMTYEQFYTFYKKAREQYDSELKTLNATFGKDSVEKMHDKGILSGDSNGNLMPKATLTREQLAVIMDKMGLLN